MLPFNIQLRSGQSVFSQVVYAAHKAIVRGELRPGDRFPSVRTLSQELKINPNTAHKVVAELIRDGLLEVRPGIGTLVSERPSPSALEHRHLLGDQVEQLVVEAKRLGLDREVVVRAVEDHWRRLQKIDDL